MHYYAKVLAFLRKAVRRSRPAEENLTTKNTKNTKNTKK